MHGWMDGATHWRLVNESLLLDSELSTGFPLKSQWEPLMGRLESVRLQVRMAEVWLVTTGGSVLMCGASNKERRKCKALILITEATRWMRPTLIPVVNTQQWSSWKKRIWRHRSIVIQFIQLHEKMSDRKQNVGGWNVTTAECEASMSTLHFPSAYQVFEGKPIHFKTRSE